LIADADQKNSYSWPLYIELRNTNSPDADINSSQGAGALVRASNRSNGSPWLVGFHSEIAHGRDGFDGQIYPGATGTSILFNGELSQYAKGGTTIGLNLQNTPRSSYTGLHAINIQSSSSTQNWQNGIHFEGPGTTGNIGINYDSSHFNMGIDLADNSIRMNANQKFYLEKYSTIYFWYNSSTGKVELVKGGSVVASW